MNGGDSKVQRFALPCNERLIERDPAVLQPEKPRVAGQGKAQHGKAVFCLDNSRLSIAEWKWRIRSSRQFCFTTVSQWTEKEGGMRKCCVPLPAPNLHCFFPFDWGSHSFPHSFIYSQPHQALVISSKALGFVTGRHCLHCISSTKFSLSFCFTIKCVLYGFSSSGCNYQCQCRSTAMQQQQQSIRLY